MVSLGSFFYIHYRKIFRRTSNTEAGLVINFQKTRHLFFILLFDELLSEFFSIGKCVFGSAWDVWVLLDAETFCISWQKMGEESDPWRWTDGICVSFGPILGFSLSANFWHTGAWHKMASVTVLAAAISLHTIGVVIMMSADSQKYFTLKYHRGLIREGLFKYIRHPNYLGEIMLYASYALIVQHWIPWAILAWVWIGVFLVNILQKEASMSRHPEWAEYKKQTGMLIPKFL